MPGVLKIRNKSLALWEKIGGVSVGGSSILSRCFFTDVTSAGTITNKTYEANTIPANKILTGFEADNDDITLTVEIHSVEDGYMPDDVQVAGGGATPVTITKGSFSQLVTNGRVWTASVNLPDADTTGTLTATLAGGDTSTVSYTRALDPPDILTAAFDTHAGTTGGDPLVQAAQTETTSVDGTQTVRITGTCDTHATRLWVKNAGISNGEQGPFTISGGTFDITANVRSSGNTGARTATVECAVGVSGTRGGSLATSNTVTVSHTQPSLSLVSLTYPGTQAAIKSAENCRIIAADSNDDAGDTVQWDDNSTSDFDDLGTMAIATSEANVDAGTYAPTSWGGGTMWVERQSSNYTDTTNVRITKTRTAKNGTNSVLNIAVEIAHVAPTITITSNGEGSPKVFRSRTGADKTYTITITSDQNLKAAPTLSRDASDDGPALGSFSGSNKVWTATITSQEDDTKNVGGATHDFHTLSSQNNAEISQTSIGSGSSYGVAGFEQRDIALARFDEFEPIGTMASNRDNANNITCEAVGISVLTYKTNTTQNDGGREYTIVDSGGSFDADGNNVRCTDGEIFNAAAYTLRIEEDA